MRRLITFATAEYRGQAERLVASARPYFDSVIAYSPADLDPQFYKDNAELFDRRRGFGFWVWKSHLILKNLLDIAPDDVLMYADSACILIADPSPLFELARKHGGIAVFHQRREGHKNRQFCRGDMIRLMGCDEPRYWNGDNLNAAFVVMTQTDKAVAFANEWHHWCRQLPVVCDDPSETPNAPDFKASRHDQSVLSLLAIKHGLPTFRDPSQYGNGYPQDGCDYPQIIDHQRGVVAPWMRRPKMSSIIEVSALATCPLRCTFCPQDKLGGAYSGPERMTPPMFERCLDNLVPGDAIDFSGFTEPALNPDIIQLMELAISRGHRTRLYTTGRGLNLKQAQRIAGMDLALVMLHLPDAAGHLSFSPNSVPVLDALAGHVNAHCMTMGNVAHGDVAHLYDRLPRNYGAMIDRAGNTSPGVVTLPTINHRGPIRCGVAPSLDHSVLLPSGQLALCCMDYGLAHVIGDLSAQPYAEILRGKPIQQILELQNNGGDVLCRHCTCAVKA